jgi:hypothetical protein
MNFGFHIKAMPVVTKVSYGYGSQDDLEPVYADIVAVWDVPEP